MLVVRTKWDVNYRHQQKGARVSASPHRYYNFHSFFLPNANLPQQQKLIKHRSSIFLRCQMDFLSVAYCGGWQKVTQIIGIARAAKAQNDDNSRQLYWLCKFSCEPRRRVRESKFMFADVTRLFFRLPCFCAATFLRSPFSTSPLKNAVDS